MSASSELEAQEFIGDSVTYEQVERVLNMLRERPLFIRFTDKTRDRLHLPLRSFIESTSYEAAPDDPLQREQVASSMLSMWALLQETIDPGSTERIIGIKTVEATED
jgi:hypothetical protein